MLERIFCARSKNCLNTKLIFNDTFNRRSQYTKLRKWWKLAAILLKQRKEYVRNTRAHWISVALYFSMRNIFIIDKWNESPRILVRELLLLLFLLLFSTLCLLEAYAYVECACIIVMWLQIAMSNINTSWYGSLK